MMNANNRAKLNEAKRTGKRTYGCAYKRMRSDGNGGKTQRVEIRFDEMAGCLRTPGGGSSRQFVIFVEGPSIKARLISARETARLMGLSDDYLLPKNRNAAYRLTGDGVVVPVVRYLAQHLLEPVLNAARQEKTAAA